MQRYPQSEHVGYSAVHQIADVISGRTGCLSRVVYGVQIGGASGVRAA